MNAAPQRLLRRISVGRRVRRQRHHARHGMHVAVARSLAELAQAMSGPAMTETRPGRARPSVNGDTVRLVTLGVGAQASPLRAGWAPDRPCGLRVMIDGGPGAEPAARVDAWLVTDE